MADRSRDVASRSNRLRASVTIWGSYVMAIEHFQGSVEQGDIEGPELGGCFCLMDFVLRR
jgi:hypothetical protein